MYHYYYCMSSSISLCLTAQHHLSTFRFGCMEFVGLWTFWHKHSKVYETRYWNKLSIYFEMVKQTSNLVGRLRPWLMYYVQTVNCQIKAWCRTTLFEDNKNRKIISNDLEITDLNIISFFFGYMSYNPLNVEYFAHSKSLSKCFSLTLLECAWIENKWYIVNKNLQIDTHTYIHDSIFHYSDRETFLVDVGDGSGDGNGISNSNDDELCTVFCFYMFSCQNLFFFLHFCHRN